MRLKTHFTALFAALGIASLADAQAAPAPIVLTLRGHRFTPNAVVAPAGQRFVIQIRNLDDTPEEFESYDFKVEKIMAPHATITVSVSPLKPGVYRFFGDYNPTVAQGVLRVVLAPARP